MEDEKPQITVAVKRRGVGASRNYEVNRLTNAYSICAGKKELRIRDQLSESDIQILIDNGYKVTVS